MKFGGIVVLSSVPLAALAAWQSCKAGFELDPDDDCVTDNYNLCSEPDNTAGGGDRCCQAKTAKPVCGASGVTCDDKGTIPADPTKEGATKAECCEALTCASPGLDTFCGGGSSGMFTRVSSSSKSKKCTEGWGKFVNAAADANTCALLCCDVQRELRCDVHPSQHELCAADEVKLDLTFSAALATTTFAEARTKDAYKSACCRKKTCQTWHLGNPEGHSCEGNQEQGTGPGWSKDECCVVSKRCSVLSKTMANKCLAAEGKWYEDDYAAGKVAASTSDEDFIKTCCQQFPKCSSFDCHTTSSFNGPDGKPLGSVAFPTGAVELQPGVADKWSLDQAGGHAACCQIKKGTCLAWKVADDKLATTSPLSALMSLVAECKKHATKKSVKWASLGATTQTAGECCVAMKCSDIEKPATESSSDGAFQPGASVVLTLATLVGSLFSWPGDWQ